MTEKAQSDFALGHLRVVELGDIPASYATRWLADLGADVIKIEPPGGDPNRMLPPFAGNITDPERSLAFIHANTNKRSIVLDLARETDRDTFTKLLGSANLLVEATPLGYLENLGFDDEALRNKFPRTVIVSITAFGRTGPYRHYKGSDAIANATGGFLYGQGDDTEGTVHGAESSGVSNGGYDGGDVGVGWTASCSGYRGWSADRYVLAGGADVCE